MSTSDVIADLASIKKILKKEISTKNCDTKCAACRLSSNKWHSQSNCILPMGTKK